MGTGFFLKTDRCDRNQANQTVPGWPGRITRPTREGAGAAVTVPLVRVGLSSPQGSTVPIRSPGRGRAGFMGCSAVTVHRPKAVEARYAPSRALRCGAAGEHARLPSVQATDTV